MLGAPTGEKTGPGTGWRGRLGSPRRAQQGALYIQEAASSCPAALRGNAPTSVQRIHVAQTDGYCAIAPGHAPCFIPPSRDCLLAGASPHSARSMKALFDRRSDRNQYQHDHRENK